MLISSCANCMAFERLKHKSPLENRNANATEKDKPYKHHIPRNNSATIPPRANHDRRNKQNRTGQAKTNR